MNLLCVTPAMLCALYLQVGSAPILWFGKTELQLKAVGTISAIDPESRLITISFDGGKDHVVHAGPKIKRFAQLKVGDRKTFIWSGPWIHEISMADATVPQPPSRDPSREQDTSPEANSAAPPLQSMTVTVKIIDLKVPCVVVEREDGSADMFLVEEKKQILKSFNAGDHVVITYQVAELARIK